MIAYMAEGLPKVETDTRGVAIWATDEGEPHGFLLAADAAYETAFKMLGAVATLNDRLMIAPDSVAFDVGLVGPDLDEAFRLTLDVRGTPLSLELTPAQLDQLIDGLRGLRRWVDPKRAD